MPEMTMDEIDNRLLSLLREDARQPTAELGRVLGLSRSTVQSRIARLERRGVIKGYTVRLGADYDRRLIRAHVMINVARKLAIQAERVLRDIPEVTALHSISGVHDLIAVVVAESMEQMDRLLDRIGELEGVERTVSSVILSTKLSR